MSTSTKYCYTVLRYVHDVVTGEFVNVGVVLYAPETGYLNAICRTTYRRISSAFPGFCGEHFRATMRHVQSKFERLGEELHAESSDESSKTLANITQRVLPTDDSSFQWGPIGAGIASDPAQKLEHLFNRMVMRYDEPQPTRPRKSDEDVWRTFKRDLEMRRLLRHFEPKTISVKDDEIRFDHAWKNGKWHCVEAISFDMSSADSIKDKAHKLLGQITSVQEVQDTFRLYMLVAKPGDVALEPAFESALSILNKMTCEKEIIPETDCSLLADRLALQVAEHEQQQKIIL